jgi:hypothetical protein
MDQSNVIYLNFRQASPAASRRHSKNNDRRTPNHALHYRKMTIEEIREAMDASLLPMGTTAAFKAHKEFMLANKWFYNRFPDGLLIPKDRRTWGEFFKSLIL